MRAPADTLGAVRIAALLLLAALAVAQDAPEREDDHDKFGFPIRFDADVITIHDLVRSAGVDSVEQLGNVAGGRDKLLIEKLNEKVGELYGLQVEPREVSDWLEREVARFDSEAEFYEQLAQQGQTLELHRLDIRRRILAFRLQSLIANGFVTEGRRLLPWDPRPSPQEIRIAFDHEADARRAAGSRIRWEEVSVSLTAEERKKIFAQRLFNPDLTEEELESQVQALLKPRLEKARAALKAGKSIREVAEALSVPVEERTGVREDLPDESPITGFLKTAERGQQSDLIELPQSRFLIVRLTGIQSSGSRTLADPTVVEEYFGRIAAHKQEKARAILQLRALDKTAVTPPRVREELRELLLTNLRQAHRELRQLGIH